MDTHSESHHKHHIHLSTQHQHKNHENNYDSYPDESDTDHASNSKKMRYMESDDEQVKRPKLLTLMMKQIQKMNWILGQYCWTKRGKGQPRSQALPSCGGTGLPPSHKELLQNFIHNGHDEQGAKTEAYSLRLPKLKKALEERTVAMDERAQKKSST